MSKVLQILVYVIIDVIKNHKYEMNADSSNKAL